MTSPAADRPACEHTHDDVEPRGYVAWHEWAEEMSKTHVQKRCPGCGLFKIWVSRDDRR
jgi:hypothetical protein